MQSSEAGENVITDLRTILEDALERIKTEIFGAGHEEPAPHDADQPEAASQSDAASQPDAKGPQDTAG
jgi:hypothetical protein